MTNRRVVRMLAAVCGAVVLSLPGATPAMGEDGDSARAASISRDRTGPPTRTDYYLAAADGGVFAFGDARFCGSMAGRPLAAPIVDIETVHTVEGGFGTPAEGYYLAASDGGVFAFGAARFHGSMAGRPLAAPIVAIASTPNGDGYWLLGRDGGVFAFGDAKGFVARTPLDAPVVDVALTFIGTIPLGAARSADYDAHSYGAIIVNAVGTTLLRDSIPDGDPDPGFWRTPPPADSLAAPIVAVIASYADSFWLAAADGGVFASGWSVFFHGSMAGKPLAAPVVDMVETGFGYLLAAADGGVFAFGNAPFLGSMAGKPLAAPIVGMS